VYKLSCNKIALQSLTNCKMMMHGSFNGA